VGLGRLARALRSRVWLVVIGLAAVAFGAAASSASIVASAPSQPLSGRVPGTQLIGAPQGPVSVAGYRYRIVVEPGLQAGEAGWSSFITYSLHGRGFGEGGGGGYPTKTWPFVGVTTSGPGGGPAPKADVVDYFVTGPSVAAVRFGTRTITTFTSPQLPQGDRAAVFFARASSPAVVPASGLRPPGRSIRLFALDSQGRVIPLRVPRYPIIASTFWQAPSAGYSSEPPFTGPDHPLPGVCELSQHGLSALTPEFGHVIKRIRPARTAQGEAFLSCIDTEYYLHGWPLEVAVLLDAQHPGITLGPIPAARPVTGHPLTVNVPAGPFPGALTARRYGDAWLVVQGGASLAQRLRVLRALQIRRLNLLR
jgi:hypothetical protein